MHCRCRRTALLSPVVTPAAATQVPATQTEFEAWCGTLDGSQPGRFEFLYGCVVAEPPASWPHGKVDGAMARRLGIHVEDGGLGLVFGSSQGFALPSGDTVAPDTSVILHETWEAAPPPAPERFLTVVPDLVVEILSRSTARRDRRVKRDIYERNGVREYWLVDTRRHAITVLVRGPDGRFRAERTVVGDEQACSVLLPGFAVRPSEVIP
jgi:Uma2 family endonuclease